MNENLNISLIIATYNDEKTAIKEIKACEEILKQYCKSYEIIIADDYSRDKTRQLLLKNFKNDKHYKIIFNKRNLGITANMRQLYSLAKKDFILLYSVDGDWETIDIKHLIETLIKQRAAIVIGKRKKKIGYTPYRKLISFLHRLLPLVLFGVNTFDPGGIKIVRRKLAQIKLVSTSQFFEAEIIICAKKAGYKIACYPVIYKKIHYGSGYGGHFSDAVHSLRDALKLRLSFWQESIH